MDLLLLVVAGASPGHFGTDAVTGDDAFEADLGELHVDSLHCCLAYLRCMIHCMIHFGIQSSPYLRVILR